ncbi:MAG: acetylornithine deacetylase [Blastocatellia bacterium]|nr:MAG: acetylornithine deacetylase [Blastocatellia bacterium]
MLVRVPSVNPSIAPGEAHGELEIANVARQWLESRGVRAWLEEAAPGRPNLIAEVGAGDGPRLVFCAHLDTVGTDGMSIPPFEPTVAGGRLYGRGSYDMKGSAAAILVALSRLQRSSFSGQVMAALVADEEYASIGADDFVNRHRADACVVTEPSHGELVLAHKGFVWLRLTTTGRAAHGSRFDLGVSAIASMARIVVALEQFDAHVLRRRTHPLVGPASMHCALIDGGTGLTTYAASCTMQVERRTLPGESAADVAEEIREVIRQSGETADVTVLFDRPGLTCDRDSHVARAVRDAATAVIGRPPEETGVAYWMDAAIFAAADIPTVNYGPAGAGAHEAVEWVDLASVVDCSRVLVEAAYRYSGTRGVSQG